MTPIERPAAYLEAVSAGIRQAGRAELPIVLREIARNLNVLADEAERYLEPPSVPDED